MDAQVGVPPATLVAMFASQAARTPTAPAIFFRGRATTYEELAVAVEGLASELSRHGVGPGTLVALALQRSPAAIAAILAVLTAGAAYLPLDARDPPARTAFLLSDSRAGVMLIDEAWPTRPDFAGTILELSGGRLNQVNDRGAPNPSVPDGVAYVIYTSGSSGSPKGVMLGQDATYLVDWARRAYSDAERARVAATTSLCFDPSIFEIFVPLGTGGAIVLKENALEPFGPDEQPTMLDTVPSVLVELCRGKRLPDSLLVLNVGGEPLLAPLVREVHAAHERLTLYNHYGPTEATTCATVARAPRDLDGDPSIGRPVRGAEITLVDPEGRPVADGVRGEIHIGGPGLALGYLNRPEITAERFITGPWGRRYRTGDMACWRDGELYFAGRADNQVKIRGFRVELGEIEAALRRIEGVERALATLRTTPGRAELVAYVQSATSLPPAQIKQRLAAWLPEHMLPAHVITLERLPLLPSGKIDHAALPEPVLAASSDATPVSRWERPIILVFEEVLGRAGLGPHDSFFDCGGDSLSSVRAALRLEEVLGFELPAALIHQTPTARALAHSLRQVGLQADGHVTLLKPGGAQPPLFCMSDLYGQAFNYLSLARRLPDDRPAYGLVPGPLQDEFTRDGDFGRLTECFKAEVRRLQPRGPYLITGYSAAGVLAVDLACALEAEGETVHLVLLDACLHSKGLPIGVIASWAWSQVRTVASPMGPGPAFRRLRSLATDFIGRLAPGAPNWIPRAQAAFAARMIKAAARYSPRPFSGATLMVKASERHPIDLLYDRDDRLGWSGAIKGRLVEATVPGGHHAIMREPLVAATALAVETFLKA